MLTSLILNKRGYLIDVDINISDLISRLNSFSFLETKYCCGGHDKEQFYIMFNFNLETFTLINKVFDYVIKEYDGIIKTEIDIRYINEGDLINGKYITIRSKTPIGRYIKLIEKQKQDYLEIVKQGFKYHLDILHNNPNEFYEQIKEIVT